MLKLKQRQKYKTSGRRSISFRIGKLHLLWLFGVAYAISTIYATIASIGNSTTIIEIENKRREIMLKNDRLRSEIIELSSLTPVYDNAEQLGFAAPTVTLYTDQKGIASNIQ